MNNKKIRNRRGDIVWVDLGQHPNSSVQSGRRPCLIVNTDKSRGSVYTVMPGTCKMEKADFPVHVVVKPEDVRGYLSQITIFMAEQLVTVDEKDVLAKAGYLEPESDAMKEIHMALSRQLGLEVHT